MQTHTDLINFLIKKYSYHAYLEIGVDDKHQNFDKIRAEEKIGVDPNPSTLADFIMTSDDFFTQNKKNFDIIFIDGLHHADTAYRDIINSLKFLNPKGIIVCHDMNPLNELSQKVPRETEKWNGDVWKAWVRLRSERSDLEMYVIDMDHGCGIIKAGTQKIIRLDHELTYDFFDNRRNELLNLISVEKALQKI